MHGRGTQTTSVFVIGHTVSQTSFKNHETEFGRTEKHRKPSYSGVAISPLHRLTTNMPFGRPRLTIKVLKLIQGNIVSVIYEHLHYM